MTLLPLFIRRLLWRLRKPRGPAITPAQRDEAIKTAWAISDDLAKQENPFLAIIKKKGPEQ